MATFTNAELVAQLYVGFYDRAPDPVGLDYWVGRLAAGVSMQDIGDSFAASPEASATYAFFKYPGLLSPNDFLAEVYMNVFGRAIDADGLKYYSDRMAGGESAGSIVASILGNASTNEGSPDQAFLQNKVDAGLHWALQAAATNANIYDADDHLTASANSSAHSTLDGITADPKTVDTANAASDAFFSAGDIVPLTTAVDNVSGGNGADTFTATVNGPAAADGSTLNSGDTINGGAGTDTLRIVQSAASATNYVPNLTSVENIDVQSFAGGLTLNLATSTGVKALSLTNGGFDLTANNVGNIVDLGLNGTTNGTLTANYSAAVVAGTADVQNVAINGANGVVTVAGVETMNVSVTGAQGDTGGNAVTLAGAALKTVNVSGDGNLTTTAAATVTTFNASAATGDISVNLSATGNVTATGGAGDDTFNFGASLTANDKVDGGEGVDTIRVSNAANTNLSAAADIAIYNALTSIERVAFNGAGGITLNGTTFTNTSVKTVEFNTANADTFNNVRADHAIEFGSNNDGAATITLAAGVTTLDLALMGTQGTATVNDGTNADVAGISIATAGAAKPVTVSLTSNGDLNEGATYADANFNDTGAITVASGSTFNVDGDGNLAIFGGAPAAVTAGFSANVTLDTSALTGNTVLSGSVFDATAGVVGTSAQDLTTGDTGVDNFTLGSGHDLIVFHNGNASGIIETTGTGATTAATGNIFHDVITGFKAGADGDMLFFGNNLGNAVAADHYTAISGTVQGNIDALAGGAATLLGAANLAAAGSTAGDWSAFSFAGSTYALYNGGPTAGAFDNGDILVKLVGVNVADLTDANFAV